MVLLMLATSSLSATYSFAEPSNIQENMTIENQKIENCKKSGLRAILTEKIVDGKLEVQQYVLPNIVTKEDVRRTMQIESQTSNWTYVCNSYNSGIVLFDGEALKLKENFWRDSSEIAKYVPAEWKEKNEVSTTQKEVAQNYSYQIIFSGNTDEFQENELFMTLSLELSPELQNYEYCTMIEGFESYNESIIQNNLEEKTV